MNIHNALATVFVMAQKSLLLFTLLYKVLSDYFYSYANLRVILK